MVKEEWPFWRLTALICTLFAGILYLPVLFGKVPFPHELLLWFPVWADRAKPEVRSYADLGDLITFFYPFRALAARSVKHGLLPLWNPFLLSGEPFLANPQSSLFYPINFLYYVLPLTVAWTATFVLRPLLAAFFMTIFMRSIGGSKTGSVFSGLVFAGCGFMTVWQGQVMTDSAIWLPLVCTAILRLRKQDSGLNIALAAVAFAMPVLAGHPETAAHVTLASTAFALMLWFFPPEEGKSRCDPRFVGIFMVVGILAAGLVSIQIIPTLEWLKQIRHPLRSWPALEAHQVLGWVSRDILESPNSAGIAVPEASVYMAMIAILAVPFAVFHRSRTQVIFLFLAASFALAVAYGVPPVYGLVQHIPVLGALKNFRMLVPSFAIAALAGLGISVLEERVAFKSWKRVAAVGLSASTALLTFLLIYELQLTTKLPVEFLRRPSFSATLLFIAVVVVGSRLYGVLKGRMFQIAVCSLAIFDLATFGYGYVGFADRTEIFPASTIFHFFREKEDSPFRIIEVGQPYPSNAGVLYDIHAADGYETGFTVRQRSFVQDLINPRSDGINFTLDRLLRKEDRRLDLLNVRYVVVPAYASEFGLLSRSDRFNQVFNNRDIAIFENPGFLPLTWIVPRSAVETFGTIDAELERLKGAGFNPLKSATISGEKVTPAVTDHETSTFTASSVVTHSDVAGMSIKMVASDPGLLIVSQTYYPGWKAVVDGTNADILPVDATLTGVFVPAGTHEVRLVFQPISLRIGFAVTVLSALIIAVVAWRKSA